MGTTLVGAFVTPKALLTFNIGDSRCYLFSASQLIQLSHDDVADERINHSGQRRSHAITQALGGSSFPIAVEPHINVDAPLGADETLLLCSDGLTDGRRP
jgi:protein phosphatase